MIDWVVIDWVVRMKFFNPTIGGTFCYVYMENSEFSFVDIVG